MIKSTPDLLVILVWLCISWFETCNALDVKSEWTGSIGREVAMKGRLYIKGNQIEGEYEIDPGKLQHRMFGTKVAASKYVMHDYNEKGQEVGRIVGYPVANNRFWGWWYASDNANVRFFRLEASNSPAWRVVLSILERDSTEGYGSYSGGTEKLSDQEKQEVADFIMTLADLFEGSPAQKKYNYEGELCSLGTTYRELSSTSRSPRPPPAQLLNKSSEAVNLFALCALPKDKKTIKATLKSIMTYLERSAKDQYVFSTGLEKIGILGPDLKSEAIDLVKILETTSMQTTRTGICDTLGGIGVSAQSIAPRLLTVAIQDPDLAVRSHCISALNRIIADDQKLTNQLIKALNPQPPEGKELLSSACSPTTRISADESGPGTGSWTCDKCPDLDDPDAFAGGTLTAVYYGAFSKPGVSEALLAFTGCEPHAENFGGVSLLRKDASKHWKRVFYKPGAIGACISLTSNTGLQDLICLDGYRYSDSYGFGLSHLSVRGNELKREDVPLGGLNLTGNDNSVLHSDDWCVAVEVDPLKNIATPLAPKIRVHITAGSEPFQKNNNDLKECGKNKHMASFDLDLIRKNDQFVPTEESAVVIEKLRTVLTPQIKNQ